MKNIWNNVAGFIAVGLMAMSINAEAKSAHEIDTQAQAALEQLQNEVTGSKTLIDKAAGVLVFPKVTKAALGVGGEYGEGVLLVDGKVRNYYNTVGASVGAQLGAQARRVAILFMTEDALRKFENSNGWEVGVDGSVTVIDKGRSASLNTTVRDPIVAFIYGEKGLMADLSLQGSKITRLEKMS